MKDKGTRPITAIGTQEETALAHLRGWDHAAQDCPLCGLIEERDRARRAQRRAQAYAASIISGD